MGLGESVGGLVGGGIALALAGNGGEDALKEAVGLIKKVKEPSFDYRNLTAPQLSLIAELDPVTYNAYIPDSVKTANDSPELRASLEKGLSRYNQESESGLPLQTRLAAEGAQQSMVDENKRLREAAMSDLAARGRLGSGEEFAMKVAAGQQDSNTARDMARDLAAQEIATRQEALAQGTNLAGNMRTQDFSQSQATADTVNNFAKWLSEMKTQERASNAATQNQAQAYNVGTRQNIANTNALNKYATQSENLNRRNTLESSRAGFDLSKAQAVGGALGNLAKGQYASEAAQADAIRGIGAGVGGLADTAASAYYGGGVGSLYGDSSTNKKKYPSRIAYFDN